MRLLAVVAERLAVIGCDDNERRRRSRPHIVEERREGGVRGGDFAGVRIQRVPRIERRRRLVGGVRVEDMDPEKPRDCGLRIADCGLARDPRAREGDDGRRGTFGHDEVRRRAGFTDAIVIHIEALIQSEPRVQRERADERGGRVAGRFEQGRGRARIVRQTVTAVLAQAVLEGIRAGEDARVRRQRQHRVRVCEIETHARRGERIERRRRRGAAVTPQHVRAQRVDRDQEDVLSRYRTEVRLPCGTRAGRRGDENAEHT